MMLLVDNYDSFTYNLLQYFGEYTEVEVVRNDAPDLEEKAIQADALVLSPGPGWPADAGRMEALIKEFAGRKPILGICLGHQAIAEVFGGKLGLAKQVMHGKQSSMRLEAPSILYQGLPERMDIMRYHSIVIEEMPESFQVISRTEDDGSIMGIQHESLPIFGLQYHPESIGTEEGKVTLKNFVDFVEKGKEA